LETSETPFPTSAIGCSAAQHGRELLAEGYNLSQVVHDYGDICQAITELALDRKAPITVKEFHTLNRCLDTAIAEAIAEYARVMAGAAQLPRSRRRTTLPAGRQVRATSDANA
jgi:hypothetical protein